MPKTNDIQNTINQLNNQTVAQTINMGSDYLNPDLENYFITVNGKRTLDETKFKKLIELRENIAKLNKFKPNKNDQMITVDPTNLTDDQLKELNIWIVNMLNQIPSQLGFDTHYVLTPESINYAKIVAENAQTAGFNHSNSALKAGAEYINGANDQMESIAQGYQKQSSLNTLKSYIYEALITMLFKDAQSNWGHAKHLTTENMYHRNQKEIYFGFAIDKNGILRFETFTPKDKNFVNKSGFIALDSKQNTSNVLNNELQNAKKSQEAAQVNYNNAKNELSQIQAKLDTANAQVKTAQTAYDQALKSQANADQTLTTAKTALQNADQNVATAQAKLDSAKQAYADSLKDTATKQDALKQAQATLAQKQAELDNLVALQSKANSHLADANTNYLNVERQLKDAQHQLAVAKDAFNKATSAQKEAQKQADQDPAKLQEALVTAQQNLVTAQTNLAQAQKDEAQKIFDTENSKLQELQAKLADAKQALETAKTNATKANDHYESLLNADKNLAQAQTAYDQAVLAYNKAQADLTTAQAKLDSAKQAQQQAQAELAKAKQEQMTLMNFEKAYQAAQSENPARKLNVHTVGNEKQKPAKKNNVLPQMGDKNSLAGVVLGMMTTLAALGTAIVSRRKRS